MPAREGRLADGRGVGPDELSRPAPPPAVPGGGDMADRGNPTHSTADLERRLVAVLGVAQRAVAVLVPGGYNDAADPSLNIPAEKVVAEAAILLLAAARAGASRPAIKVRLERLAGLLEPYARSERVRAAMTLEPALALDHGRAHLCLSSAGYRAPGYDRLLHGCGDPVSMPGRERSPYGQLEQIWLRVLLGDSPPAGDRGRRSAMASSMLGRRLDALTGTRADAYAMTHAVMFATDLGASPVRLPRPHAAVVADLECALAASLDCHDYDVAGEVLACWPMLRLPWTPAATFGFQVLAAAEDAAGYLPTPLLTDEAHRALQGAARTGYVLAATYHTVFVMGLLCATAIAAGSPPPSAVDISAGSPVIIPDLVAHLADGRRLQWQDHFQGLEGAQQASLAPLVLTVALRRAVAGRRLEVVRELLSLASRRDLLGGPAPAQAAQLLQRAMILAASFT